MEQAIEARLTSAEPITAAPAPIRGRVVDLMAALRDSIEAAKTEEAAAQDKPAKAPRSSKKKVATLAGWVSLFVLTVERFAPEEPCGDVVGMPSCAHRG